MTQEALKEVGIWIRVSTEDQVRGESPEHHERRARAYAEAKGWRVVEMYRLDAVSGKAVIAHPEAQRMLADISRGHITGLVFSKLARLARNTRELLEFAELFRAAGADLVSLQEAIDTNSPAGRLFFTMIAAMASWEREEIAERVAASVPIRAKMGKPLGGAAPFGFRWHHKRLEPDPVEAPVRLLLHQLFDEHQRKKTVARMLNERGHRTRNGSAFSDTTVDRLLRDTTARGVHRANYTMTGDRKSNWTLKPESDWVYTDVEPIVPTDLWERCVAVLDAQRARQKRPTKKVANLFAGYVHCGCGGKMSVWSASPKYVCSDCRNKIPCADLEAVYREQLHGFLVSPDQIAAHYAAADNTLAERETLIDQMRSELVRIEREDERLYQLYLSDALSKEDFGRRNRPLAERRRQLEDELPRLEAQRDLLAVGQISHAQTLDEARDLASRWQTLPHDDRRAIVETITDRIIVRKEDVEIYLLHLPSGRDDTKATRPCASVAYVLPMVSVRFEAVKPERLPLQGDSLAANLRRRRETLGIFQRDAASIIGVDQHSVIKWESGKEPMARYYPAIIQFLGYEPWPLPTSMAQALVAVRRRRGLSAKQSAKINNVDEATWARWERGGRVANDRHAKAVISFVSPHYDFQPSWARV